MLFSTLFSVALSIAGTVSAAAIQSRATPLAKVYSKCTKSKTVALTFDDGPWVYMYDIGKTLTANNATGTFFLNGNNYECIYENNGKRTKWLYDKGHQIASHTWAHKDLTSLTWDQIHDEMWKVELAFQRITGATPAFMRPPYGNYNDLVRQASYIRNQSLVIWDFDSQDSLGASVAESEALYKAALDKNPDTMLALNHETYETTAHQVLPYVINLLKSKGYKMVSLAECLGLQPYHSVGSPQTPDSNWHC